jgi:hypothetical protein
MSDDPDHELRRIATRRADAKLGFRSHLIVYAMVNGGLVALNLATSPGYLWSLWPALGWGIGLFAHGASVYGFVGADRERMIEQELVRLRAQGNPRK